MSGTEGLDRGGNSLIARIEVARVDELPVGTMRAVSAGDRRIALYRTIEGFFASDERCPHRGGPLTEGDLIGNEVVCPWHLWSFDVRTGLTEGAPGMSMRCHRVDVVDGRVFILLPPREISQEPV